MSPNLLEILRQTQRNKARCARGSNRNRLLGFTQTMTNTRGTRTLASINAQVRYGLDAAGNFTSDGLRNFVYDGAGRLAQVRIGLGSEEAGTRYLHNALGQRVFKSEPLAEQYAPDEEELGLDFIAWLKKGFGWLFDKAQANATLGQSFVYADAPLPEWALLGEYGNGGSKSAGRLEIIWLPTDDGSALPVGLYRNGRFYAIHPDHLGTPRLITDDANQPVWQWPYSAFGANKPTGILKATAKPKQAFTNEPVLLKATKPGVTFNLRFPGQYFDEESNLSYNYFRSYQAAQGRYTQGDPIGLEGGLNRFGYGEGNALRFVDAFGLLSSREAFMHYLAGTGTAKYMQFSEIDTSSVKPSQFPKVKAELGKGCQQKRVQLDDRAPFTSSGDAFIIVGNITLRLQGTLSVECDCSWRFDGVLKSFNDRYDFNPSTHRSRFGEFSTKVGSMFPGAEFEVHIQGGKPISESGHL